MPEAQPFEVFISHYVEEKAIAEELQDYLRDVFGDELHVFRSSDDGSIRTGEDQFRSILKALEEAKVYIALLSKYGACRPWLNFEVGFGKARGVPIKSVLIRGTKESDIPTPISQLEIRALANTAVVEDIVNTVALQTGRSPDATNTAWFLKRLQKSESAMPNRELRLVPFRYPQGLGFELRYNGPRPIKIISVWAELPWDLLLKNWPRGGVTGFLLSDTVTRDSKTFLRREYIANTGTPDVRESGSGWTPLHPHCAPRSEPYLLKELRFSILEEAIAVFGQEVIRCQVITEDGTSEVFEYRFDSLDIRSGQR